MRCHACSSNLLEVGQELVDRFSVICHLPAQEHLPLRSRASGEKCLTAGGPEKRAPDIRLGRKTGELFTPHLGDVDKVVADLDSQEGRGACLLVKARQVIVGDEPGANVAARQRQCVHRRAQVEAVGLLVEPAGGQEPADEAVDGSHRSVYRSSELRERDAWTVDDGLQDLSDAVHGAVMLGCASNANPRGGLRLSSHIRIYYPMYDRIMRVTRSGLETGKGSADWFTGAVYVDAIASPSSGSRLSASSVHFTPGARTAWHTHPNGQTIWVTEGVGLAPRRGGPVEVIRAGDRVFFEPREDHWHGAAPNRFMTHLAMLEVDAEGRSATWGDHVTNEEYAAAPGIEEG